VHTRDMFVSYPPAYHTHPIRTSHCTASRVDVFMGNPSNAARAEFWKAKYDKIGYA
jgi:hypothetical protein